MTNELVIRLANTQVGTLTRTRRGARFSYSDAVQGFTGQPLLSCSLPVKSRHYSEGLTSAWFEGLLPEGERLSRLCRQIGCREGDWFEVLTHVGWECAGAVSVCEPGFEPPAPQAPHVLCESELAEILRSLPSLPGNPGAVRVSLGGYQEKAAVVCEGFSLTDPGVDTASRIALPDAATVSTHILKPQPATRYAGIVEAEAWAMAAASAAARCANAWLLAVDGAPRTLIIERFDRSWCDGHPVRIHQEDCCQAMGLPPLGKYANEKEPKGDDPSYAKIAVLLTRYAADPEAELRELARQMTTNLAMGNVDAHAKNHAFLYRTLCTPTLAPLYDVVPVDQVEPSARLLSMRINGKLDAAGVEGSDLIVEARSWGLPEAAACETIFSTLMHLEKGLEQAGNRYPDAAERYAPHVLDRIAALRG